MDLVEIPLSMQSIWRHFINLHNTRTAGMSGVNPIQYSEISAYFSLNQEVPEVWEVNTLRRLDSVVLEHFADLADKEQKKAKNKTK